jgi:hypothetical protein
MGQVRAELSEVAWQPGVDENEAVVLVDQVVIDDVIA